MRTSSVENAWQLELTTSHPELDSESVERP